MNADADDDNDDNNNNNNDNDDDDLSRLILFYRTQPNALNNDET